MTLDQHRLDFLANNIKQYEAELDGLKSLKADLNAQRNEKQKEHERFVQSMRVPTINEIRAIDWSTEVDNRRIESGIFELKAEDNQLNVRKGTLQRLIQIISSKNNNLAKAAQDNEQEFIKLQNEIQSLENKLESMDVIIQSAENNIEAERDNQAELERRQQTETMELIFDHDELLSAELTEYQLRKQI
ncbi:unnamed protein product, partial [Adineta ricciae]